MAGLDGSDTSSTVYIDDLVPTNPATDDAKSQGDDHLRFIKRVLKNTFPNIDGPVTATQAELNITDGLTATVAELNIMDGVTATASELNKLDGVTATTAELNYVVGLTELISTSLAAKASTTDVALKAPLASPTFTGTVVLPSTTSIGNVSSTEIGYLDGVTEAINTRFTNLKKFDIQFNLDVGADGSYTIVQDAQFAFTIDSAYYQTESGTITVNVKYDGTNSVTSLSALSVTSTEANATAGATKTVSAGNKVVITTSSNSSAVKLSVLLHCTRS